MSVRVLAVTPRSSLVLALTMLVPDWDVDAATDAAQVAPGDGFDVLVIEATRTDEGLATLHQLRAAGVDQPAVVAGDIFPEGDVGAPVIPRPFTVQELCERIMALVHPPVVEDPPTEVPEPALEPPAVTIEDEPAAEPPKRRGLLTKLRRPRHAAVEAPAEADTAPELIAESPREPTWTDPAATSQIGPVPITAEPDLEPASDPEPGVPRPPAEPQAQPRPVPASRPLVSEGEPGPASQPDPEPEPPRRPTPEPVAADAEPEPQPEPVEPTPAVAPVAVAPVAVVPSVVTAGTPPVPAPPATVDPDALTDPEDDDLAGFQPVALLAELINAFEPVTAAIWVQDDARQWRVIEHLGLRRAEAGRSVPPDQPFFAAISGRLHGMLLSPADLARGYLGGVPGTWTEDVMAAPVAHRKQCLAIVVVGGDGLTERATRQFATLTGAATDRPSLRRFRKRLGLLTARL
jgi:hypothetical protein